MIEKKKKDKKIKSLNEKSVVPPCRWVNIYLHFVLSEKHDIRGVHDIK